MKIYRVGGAVRDKLLGLDIRESDWVVVGATPEQLLQQGYRLVGKDFPVFLHPLTHEEYALARTERKTAPGYHGFSVHAAPDVTLEDDLHRRDLTVNAMAEDANGAIIDPFGGRADLDARLLRHISPAFAEDPVRILRVARFAATLAPLGFAVAGETLELMRGMVEAGEADALVAERVWKETERALGAPAPARFFEVLRDCGALAKLFPEVDALYGVPQPPQHHPEIDTGVHTMMVLTQAARLSPDARVRFAALVHDLGKGTTDPKHWPKHHGHEERGLKSLDALCDRLRVPKDFRELAQHVMQYHGQYHRAEELRPATILKLLKAVDALRRPERFELFMLACEADSRGRPGFEELHYEQPGIMRRALAAANSVLAQQLIDEGYSGAKLGRELDKRRIAAIAAAVK